jgi:hypothetical protein
MRTRPGRRCGVILLITWALLMSACNSGSSSGQAAPTPNPTPTTSAPAPVATTNPPQSPSSTPTRNITAGPSACVAIRPGRGFYEAGRVATEELTTPTSRCTTIAVSDVVDAANSKDRCQTFLVGFWPLVDGSLTYTEPVKACGTQRTVLARNVADNARYIVLYQVDYIEPSVQTVRFKVWH